MVDIGVCSMIRNEIEILPAYYRYIKKWANSWYVLDHGSNDGSLEFLYRMKDRDEISIEVLERPSLDFNKDFYREVNYIISKCKNKWTFWGHIDEFIMNAKEVFQKITQEEAVYSFTRLEMIQLCPPLYLTRETFVRLFPTSWKIRWREGHHVHSESPVIPKDRPIKRADCLMFHIGRCRNIEHIREKERSYEACSGSSVLGSKYSEERREEERRKAKLLEVYIDISRFLI